MTTEEKLVQWEVGIATAERPEKHGMDTRFEDLDIDSLEFLDLMLQIGEKAGKEIPMDKLSEMHTLGDVARFLARVN